MLGLKNHEFLFHARAAHSDSRVSRVLARGVSHCLPNLRPVLGPGVLHVNDNSVRWARFLVRRGYGAKRIVGTRRR